MQTRAGRNGKADVTHMLRADESGVALIYATLMLPVVIGFALLAVDVGRFTTLNSSLQHGADALALAGAAELDGRPDAITRAEEAMKQFITENTALFTSSAAQLDWTAIKKPICFMSDLPASDATPIKSSDCLDKEDPTQVMRARYVQVLIEPKQYDTIFPATFVGALSNSVSTQAEAVAGFQAAVCDFTPMFICNPYEAVGNMNVSESAELMKHFDRENYPDRIGRLIRMKQTGGNNAQYFPGNFGFLIPQGADANPGANTLRQLVGMANPPACFVSAGVELRTGAITSVRFGFNTRFDMYEGPMGGSGASAPINDSMYRPALNVRKGMANDKASGKGSACNPEPDNDNNIANNVFAKLPRDNCFLSNTCSLMGGRMGDGSWNRDLYWSQSYNGAAWPADLPKNATRYDVYQYEIEKDRTKLDSNGTPAGGELGNPRCWKGDEKKLSKVPDRRIFHAAILNCQALNASSTYGPITGGSSKKLPVVAFARFFITEPVLSANASAGGKDDDRGKDTVADGDIFAEMVGIDEPGNGDGVARDIVQLYR